MIIENSEEEACLNHAIPEIRVIEIGVTHFGQTEVISGPNTQSHG
jgi:hypothetical protein